MPVLFFSIGSKSTDSIFMMSSRFLRCLIICEISLVERVRWDRKRKPLGDVFLSIGLSIMSLAIESSSWSPSNVRFDRSVFERFSERAE